MMAMMKKMMTLWKNKKASNSTTESSRVLRFSRPTFSGILRIVMRRVNLFLSVLTSHNFGGISIPVVF